MKNVNKRITKRSKGSVIARISLSKFYDLSNPISQDMPTDSTKDKMKEEYDSIFKRAKEIESIRQKLQSDLIELRTQLIELEQKYKTTLGKRVESTSESLLPMTISLRAAYGILFDEYISIRDNRRIGEYKMMGYYV